jgi:hypothetical protein
MNENELQTLASTSLTTTEEYKTADFNLKKVKIPKEVSDAIESAYRRYKSIHELVFEGRGVMAGLKATNDPEYAKAYNTLGYFIDCLESRLK